MLYLLCILWSGLLSSQSLDFLFSFLEKWSCLIFMADLLRERFFIWYTFFIFGSICCFELEFQFTWLSGSCLFICYTDIWFMHVNTCRWYVIMGVFIIDIWFPNYRRNKDSLMPNDKLRKYFWNKKHAGIPAIRVVGLIYCNQRKGASVLWRFASFSTKILNGI